MAIQWEATITIQDAKGKNSRMSVHFETLDFDVMSEGRMYPTEFAYFFAQSLDTVSGGKITDIRVSTKVDTAGLKAIADPNSDVEEKGTIVARTAAGKTRITLPAFNADTYTIPGTKEVDYTNDPTLNELTLVIVEPVDGSADWQMIVTDYRGEDIIDIDRFFEDFR